MPRGTAPLDHPSTTDAIGDPAADSRRPARTPRRPTAGTASRASTRPPDRRASPGPASTGNLINAVTITVHDVLWEDPTAAILRASMAAESRGRYADRPHDPTPRPTGLDPIDPDSVSYTAVATVDGEPVGHLALCRLRGDVELTRMYVVPEWRRRGVSTALLNVAEAAADRLGARRIILQTGIWQPDAVHCYRKHGFHEIATFTPDKATADALCFAKHVRAVTA